ncbi:MAG: hypothetical protein WB792_01485 [Desulfobacterales bacterium]
MEWFKVYLIYEQAKANEHIKLQKEFHKLFIENQTPEGMALFSDRYEWDNQVFFPFYFSPASVQFAKTLLSSHSGAPCEEPKKEYLKLLSGRPVDFDLLE